MAAIKIHVYRKEMGDSGEESCDYRGSGEHGAGENDQHRTVSEKDPATDAEITPVLRFGPQANRFVNVYEDMLPGWTETLADLLGLEGSGPVGLRIGVWDH